MLTLPRFYDMVAKYFVRPSDSHRYNCHKADQATQIEHNSELMFFESESTAQQSCSFGSVNLRSFTVL